ncbi:hypothetical protein FHX45_002292 [Amycolatopsis granulosa]|uniref:Uncharacterized protein n=1 Tax=Amycolatopsis viridis TaxID=185678 RepID=A0ABX0T4A7_9PSEU|nr:hypothetical protein [Amycolatopsis viridis]NIH85399.1 hypothetical protein [Amycolatopsis granulosa]
MTRLLTSLKFWALTLTVAWIAVVAVLIADHPELAQAR